MYICKIHQVVAAQASFRQWLLCRGGRDRRGQSAKLDDRRRKQNFAKVHQRTFERWFVEKLQQACLAGHGREGVCFERLGAGTSRFGESFARRLEPALDISLKSLNHSLQHAYSQSTAYTFVGSGRVWPEPEKILRPQRAAQGQAGSVCGVRAFGVSEVGAREEPKLRSSAVASGFRMPLSAF